MPQTKIERSHLPIEKRERKAIPLYTGVLEYFPDALVEVARLSYVGNEQHNPGEPLHWAKEKSADQEDALMRHLLESGTFDTDGIRHSAKVAWRALAMLQLEIETERGQAAPDERVQNQKESNEATQAAYMRNVAVASRGDVL